MECSIMGVSRGMTKLNSLSFAVALSLSVIPLKSEAIGLGKYENYAQLNQPLNLSIPLLTEHDDLTSFKAYLADYKPTRAIWHYLSGVDAQNKSQCCQEYSRIPIDADNQSAH